MRSLHIFICFILVSSILPMTASSAPTFVQEQYRWRNDDGSEASASWDAELNRLIRPVPWGKNIRLRFVVANTGGAVGGTNVAARLEYSTSTDGVWAEVATTIDGPEAFEMTTTTGYANEDATTAKLVGTGDWKAGRCVESPSNTSVSVGYAAGEYSNFEYCFKPTTNAQKGVIYYFRLTNSIAGTDWEYDQYATLTMTQHINVVFIPPAFGDPVSDPWAPPLHYRELFENPDGWAETRSRIDEIAFYSRQLGIFSDEDLGAWMPMVTNWGLNLGLEVGAVKNWALDTAAYAFKIQTNNFDRIERTGVTIHSFAMDEPYYASIYAGIPGGDLEYAVEQTAQYMELTRAKYPTALVGDIEPYPAMTKDELVNFITLLEARCVLKGIAGLDFFRVDPNWIRFIVQNDGSWQEIKEIEDHCRSLGIDFSMCYIPSGTALKPRNKYDEYFYMSAFHTAQSYLAVGGAPDEFAIQSWDVNPRYSTPDSADFTMTRATLDFCKRFLPHRAPRGIDTVVTVTATDDHAKELGLETGAFTITRLDFSTRQGVTNGELSVKLDISGSALGGVDYASVGTTVVIPDGSSNVVVTVTPLADTDAEGTEDVTMTVLYESGAPLYLPVDPVSADVSITDDDSRLVLVVSTPGASEIGPVAGIVTLTRQKGLDGPLTVYYEVDVSSTASTNDYSPLSGSVAFADQQSSAPITLTPVDDATPELDETIKLNLLANAAYELGSPTSGTITIAGNDNSPPSIDSYLPTTPLGMLVGTSLTFSVTASARKPSAAGLLPGRLSQSGTGYTSAFLPPL